jgi:hypothetical protein
VADIVRITFAMSGIGFSDLYTYPWKLAFVDIRVNQQPFCRVLFDTWIGPGEQSGSFAARTITV